MKFISLFGGIGGFDLALKKLGHKCVFYNDFDKYAVMIYNKNNGTKYEPKDIREVDESEIPDHDILCGGFPCQTFSIAGKRAGFEDTRGTMFFEVARIIKAKRPKYIFLENVKGLLSHDKGKTFRVILQTLDELWYDVEWQICNSKNYGVPQNRERVFIIGHLREESTRKVFPIGQSGSKDNKLQKYNSNTLTSRYTATGTGTYIGQGELHAQKQGSRDQQYVKVADYRSDEGLRVRKEFLSPCLISRRHSETDIFNMSPFVLAYLTPDRAEKRQNGRRFKTDGEPSFTLTSQDIHGVMLFNRKVEIGDVKALDMYNKRTREESPTLTDPCHNSIRLFDGAKIRRLTPIECERLQGFPDFFTSIGRNADGEEFEISDPQRYKCLGNAVTVNVIAAIGERLG